MDLYRDLKGKISIFSFLDIYIYPYGYMDIHISIYGYLYLSIYLSIYLYPQGYPCETFRYLHVDIQFKVWIFLWISRCSRVTCNTFGERAIRDIYMPMMPSIIPQPLATDPSHGRAKIAAIYVKLFVIV